MDTPHRRRSALAMTALALALAATVTADLAAQNTWQSYRDRLLQDERLIRFYDLGAAPADSRVVRNRADRDPQPLRLTGEEEPTRVAGLLPGRQAFRLDRFPMEADAFPVSDQSFSVMAWVRKHGPGIHRGNNDTANGTILSVGIGYWDGWRITTWYPEHSVGFALGRPSPVNAYVIRSSEPMADGVWHHLAGTWDGEQMRLYVDGLPVAQSDYSDPYTEPEPGAPFRVGYAGFGVGSAIMDVDSVAVFQAALSPQEILDHTLYSIPPETLTITENACEAAIGGSPAEAAAAWRNVLESTADIPPTLNAFARLARGRWLARAGEAPQSSRALAAILDDAQAPPWIRETAVTDLLRLVRAGMTSALASADYERLLAMPFVTTQDRLATRMGLADALTHEGRFDAAAEHYQRILADPDVPPEEKGRALLQAAHTARAAGHIDVARDLYRRLSRETRTRAPIRAYAELCIAQMLRAHGRLDEAVETYQRVAAMPEAPDHVAWEARECVREIKRLQQDLPARDPAWHRVAPPTLPEPGLTLHLSPDGSDNAPGTADAPLRSLEAARDLIRTTTENAGVPAGGIHVLLHEGTYVRETAFELSSRDSGTPTAPIVYRAAPGERPVFTGGRAVRDLDPVTDPEILARLPEAVRNRVRVADLHAAGITDFGTPRVRGFGKPASPSLEVFAKGQALRPAQWPNDGFVSVGDIVEGDREGPVVFRFESDRPLQWQNPETAWMFGYWYHHWADGRVPVNTFDLENRTITVTDMPAYGIRQGQHYLYTHVLEELDQTGEWFLDRQTGKLYLLPPPDTQPEDIVVSVLDEPMITLDQVSHTAFLQLTLQYGRLHGIVAEGGTNLLLAGCALECFGGDALLLSDGKDHRIVGCDMRALGRGGMRIAGGDRATLTPGDIVIENNHVHDFSRLDRTYTPAVHLSGVGNRVAHNLFHDSPHHAMRIEGNDHLIEFNEVHSVVYEADDQSGVDMWFNPTYRGNVIRYNFWHHIGSGLDRAGQAGIRLDDAISGTLVYSNVFFRSAGGRFGAVQIHGGKENIIDNNLFVDCSAAVSFSNWGEARWESFLEGDRAQAAMYEDVDIRQPPYSTRYPDLARMQDDPDVNMIWRNIAAQCGQFILRDRGIHVTLDNLITSAELPFKDRADRDLSLPADADVYRRIGFRPIPFAEIGLYQSPWRASWPVDHAITPHYQGERD